MDKTICGIDVSKDRLDVAIVRDGIPGMALLGGVS
jgi:hypothetical protein